MKLKKIFLILVLFFVGLINIKAIDYNENDYEKYEKAYRIIAALNYYHNNSAAFGDNGTESNNILTDAKSKFIPADNNVDLIDLYKSVSDGSSGALANKICNAAGLDNDGTYINELAKYDSLAGMMKYALNYLKNYAKGLDKNSGQNTFIDMYNDVVDRTKVSYSTFCDYLENHKGISYYVQMALRLISYVALALAVILGALDFIRAITSQDDAALTKAFQSFVKRLIAAALVFLSYLIVQLIMGLVTSIPYYNAESLDICEQLKIGGFKK